MANNALAPNIDNVLSDYVYAGRKLKEQRTNNLLNPQVKTAMTLADLQALKGAPTQRTPTLGERVEGLSYAAGEGFKDQLEGFKQMLTTNPKDTLMAMYEGLKHVVQDPGILADMGKQAVSSPENFTRFLAQNLNPMDLANVLNKVGTMRELTVYHGTPHKFEPTPDNPLGEFTASKIGTGEGAQVYGHGIYVAESPDVAKSYKTAGSDTAYARVTGGLNPMEEYAYDLVSQGRTGEDLFSAMQQKYGKLLKSDADIDAFDAAIKKAESAKGSFYTVDLPDEKIDQMLDWDKPLNEQPQLFDALKRSKNKTVQFVINQIGDPSKPIMSYGQDLGLENGQGLMRRLSYALDGKPNSPKASAILQKLGIPGVKYFDAGSRGTGAGTRNFVVFPGEEKSLKILKRE